MLKFHVNTHNTDSVGKTALTGIRKPINKEDIGKAQTEFRPMMMVRKVASG